MAVRTIALIHHVHTDFGYTDHPQRAKAEHIRYIDQAIDGVLTSADYPEGARFAWTQEQLYPVRQWWERASERQKERFFAAVGSGRLEITGTPFNVTALMSREEWETAMRWIPDGLWDRCRIRSAVQIDVNGMHTGGMLEAYRRGVRNLFIGPNTYYGVPPMPTPAAFFWQIDPRDPEKRMFVWLNASYNNGYFLFQENWRQGPVPDYADLRYRPPERGDIWRSDERSVLEAHRRCLSALAQIEGTAARTDTAETDGFTKNRVFGGYAAEVLPVSVTSQWRVDNDPPFYPIVDFVRRWNEMGLEPRLTLRTVSQAMDMVKDELGDKIPVYRGEWADWWANGSASSPVELAYKREALRTLRAARSPLFGPEDGETGREAREILENLCLYDEHSFGSWQSVSDPYSFASVSQTAEKNLYAYRALDAARCLLADRVRKSTEDGRKKNAIYVWNPTRADRTVSIRLPLNCMRGEYRSVRCEETGALFPVEAEDGPANFLRPSDPSEFGPENVSHTFSDKCEKQGVRIGPVTIPAMGRLCLIPGTEPAPPPSAAVKACELETGADGWPVRVRFLCQSAPVIDGPFGDFFAVQADGFAPRWTFRDIFENDDEAGREALRAAHLHEIPAKTEQASRADLPGQIVFTQRFSHASLDCGVRELTVDLVNARVSLEVRISRRSDFTPEVLILRFDAPESEELPVVSNAGVRFRPEKDQLPGSCMDFYAVDGWARYDGGWLFSCRDSALIGFGTPGVVARKTSTGGPANRIFARVFDNTWDTNFRANACGQMRFRFSASADVKDEDAEILAEAMDADPVVQVKTGYAE